MEGVPRRVELLLLTVPSERLLEEPLLLTLEEELRPLAALLEMLVVVLRELEETSPLLTEDEALRAADDVVERRPSIRPVAARVPEVEAATRLVLPERRSLEDAIMLLPVARRFTLPATALAWRVLTSPLL